ncbi:hypothetical protein GCM10029992_06650 [Glycomyces albus]
MFVRIPLVTALHPSPVNQNQSQERNCDSPLHRPWSAVRSRRRFLALLAAGLGLVALGAVYLVLQLNRDDSLNVEVDFAEGTCEEFDLAGFAESSAISVEASNTTIWDDPDTEGGSLHCNYTSDSGLALTVSAVARADEDAAADYLELARLASEADPNQTIENFDNGDHTGFTGVFSKESLQHFTLFSAEGRLTITVRLESRPAAFEPSDAVGLVEALATRAHERFEAYD